MAGIYLQEFECTHCRQTFTLEEGDLIVPGPRLCDDCLKRLWHLTSQELTEEQVEESNLQLLHSYQQEYELEALIGLRDNTRQKYA